MRHLWLIGMMGSGKSHVGRRIAELSGLPFVDTDDRIVFESGRSISDMFDVDGEAEFRSVEETALRSAAAEPVAVIATGGGAVLSEVNVEVMRRSGTVIYLEADPSTLARRVGADESRPLLRAGDPLGAMTEILNRRGGLYRAAAHVTIQSDDRDLDEVAREAIAVWNES